AEILRSGGSGGWDRSARAQRRPPRAETRSSQLHAMVTASAATSQISGSWLEILYEFCQPDDRGRCRIDADQSTKVERTVSCDSVMRHRIMPFDQQNRVLFRARIDVARGRKRCPTTRSTRFRPNGSNAASS